MVNVTGVPVQVVPALVKVGVTVMVAVTGADPRLTAVKAAIFPEPLAAKPMLVVLFVQVYTVPVTGPVMVTAAVVAPLHKTWFTIGVTAGVGFTVMV